MGRESGVYIQSCQIRESIHGSGGSLDRSSDRRGVKRYEDGHMSTDDTSVHTRYPPSVPVPDTRISLHSRAALGWGDRCSHAQKNDVHVCSDELFTVAAAKGMGKELVQPESWSSSRATSLPHQGACPLVQTQRGRCFSNTSVPLHCRIGGARSAIFPSMTSVISSGTRRDAVSGLF